MTKIKNKVVIEEAMLMSHISKYVNAINQKKVNKEKMICDRTYVELFQDIMEFLNTEEQIDNQGDKWNKDVDMMFDLLSTAAYELLALDKKGVKSVSSVILEHQNRFIELTQLYGQGYYCSMVEVVDDIDNLKSITVKFDDIIDYLSSGVKPHRTQALELIYVALSSIGVVAQSFELDFDIEAVIKYIELNLK